MVLEKAAAASLHTMSKFDCIEYLSKLRYSLGKEQEKATLNEKRRVIHLIETRLRKLEDKD